MTGAIPFPDLSPELFSIEIGGFGFALRWYALAYIVGILLGWALAAALLRRPALWPARTAPMTRAQLEDMVTWIILGVVLGGRLGYVAFYQPGYYLANPGQILMLWQGGMAFHGGLAGVMLAVVLFCQPGYYLQNPVEIVKVWQGGMAFHGGLLGVMVACFGFAWSRGIKFLSLADLLCMAAPVGLLLGRIANFINGELWGRPTDLPWGVIFPGEAAQACGQALGTLCARHPSQLYEAALEGALLGAVLLWLALRRKALHVPGVAAGVFFAGYGLARVIVEFVRQPDPQFVSPGNPLGLAWHIGGYGLTMGQILSLPMIALGAWLILSARAGARAHG